MDLEVPSSRKGVAFHPENVYSDLARFPGPYHCSSSVFLWPQNEPKTVHHRDLILIMSSLLFLQVAFSACESSIRSRIIRLGRKCFVDEKVGAFSLVLV